MRAINLVLALVGCIMFCGCWTSASEGEQLRTAGQSRNLRIAELENKHEALITKLDAKAAELEEVLQKATALLARNSADRGVQIEQMQEQLAALEGQVAELRHGLEVMSDERQNRESELEQRLVLVARKAGIDIPVPDADIPEDKEAHFSAAQQAFKASEHSRSRALFREYVNRYPKDDQTDNAQYWIGLSYLMEKKPATALGEFRKVISQHANGDAVDPVLLGMAEAFYELHACTDAKSALDALIRRKPSRNILRKAKQKLREIKRAPAGYCTS